MNTYPLTAAGVEDFLDELYALNTSQLEEQADDVAANFKTYVSEHFSLTTAQEDYLTAMDNRVCQYWGSLCSVAFVNKLTINLEYPAPPAPGYGKWTEEHDDMVSKLNDNGDTEVTGSITFKMSYRPL